MKFLSPLTQRSVRSRRRIFGMALNIINVGRNNQRYPTKDITVVNNDTYTQLQGAIVILSWTPEGTVHQTIPTANLTAAIIASHQKAVVLDTAGLPPSVGGAIGQGRVRVQGTCRALLAANGTYNMEDPLFILSLPSPGGSVLLQKSTPQNIGSASGVTPATAVAFLPQSETANAADHLSTVIFDGTDVNSMNIFQA